MKPILILFTIVVTTMGCENDKSFNGSTNAPVPPEETPAPEAETPAPTAPAAPTPGSQATAEEIQQCVQEGTIKASIPTEIQGCLDRGPNFMWEFYRPTGQEIADPCVAITPPAFECTFDSMITATTDLFEGDDPNVARELVEVKDQALMLSCAENHEGQTFVAQFIRLPEGTVEKDCSVKTENIRISTRCFRKYDGEKPPETTDPEVITQRTRACLDQ